MRQRFDVTMNLKKFCKLLGTALSHTPSRKARRAGQVRGHKTRPHGMARGTSEHTTNPAHARIGDHREEAS